MALDVVIKDGHGSNKAAKVNGEGEFGVVIHTHPPVDESVTAYPFRQFLTSTGVSTGSRYDISAYFGNRTG